MDTVKEWCVSLMLLAFSMLGSATMVKKLKIEVMQQGNGDVAEHGQRVIVHYEGRLTDDTVFDASRPRGQPFSFNIGAGQVIQGWEEGVTGMKVGEMRRLTIPADLGYGATGAGGIIPPHATLVFDIELLSVTLPVSLGQATPADLLHAQDDGVIIVDVRRPDEWSHTGIIAGAKTITAFEANGNFNPHFKQKFMTLVPPAETPVLLYCLMGARTTNLGMALIDQLGYLNVTHLSRGIMGWTAEGYETIAYKP